MLFIMSVLKLQNKAVRALVVFLRTYIYKSTLLKTLSERQKAPLPEPCGRTKGRNPKGSLAVPPFFGVRKKQLKSAAFFKTKAADIRQTIGRT